MKRLSPLHAKDIYSKALERQILQILYDLIYAPIAKSVGISKKEIKNSAGDLEDAIVSGKIYLDGDQLKGQFTSKTSRELRELGAKFSKGARAWTFDVAMPPLISTSIAKAAAEFEQAQARALSALNSVKISDINNLSEIPDAYVSTIGAIDKDFRNNVKKIGIAPELSADQIGKLTADWSYNMDLLIKGWSNESIEKLRDKIMNGDGGARRAKSVAIEIQRSFKATKAKARFLARQETSLLVSKMRQIKYTDIGVTKYVWETSADERVREDHRDLNGQTFDWDSPPIVDKKSGRRAHPGEDFGCRCVPIPIIE